MVFRVPVPFHLVLMTENASRAFGVRRFCQVSWCGATLIGGGCLLGGPWTWSSPSAVWNHKKWTHRCAVPPPAPPPPPSPPSFIMHALPDVTYDACICQGGEPRRDSIRRHPKFGRLLPCSLVREIAYITRSPGILPCSVCLFCGHYCMYTMCHLFVLLLACTIDPFATLPVIVVWLASTVWCCSSRTTPSAPFYFLASFPPANQSLSIKVLSSFT